jgi:hypothetical protein
LINFGKFKVIGILSLTIGLLSGCASFGQGVAEAVFNKQAEVDLRRCEIWGKPFSGFEPHLAVQHGRMKVLMVHGVGDHLAGYSTQFLEKLARELNLPVRATQYKEIALTSRRTATPLGNLRINRLLSKDRQRELIFYELTWSPITSKQKSVLAYDNSGEYAFRRAEVNDLMKKFSNDTTPDPIIYLGDSRDDILTSFAQSFCWMTKSSWEDLPTGTPESCSFNDESTSANILTDDYAIVSHSLGSRISIDGMQRIASVAKDRNINFRQALQQKELPIYMLSNQLPMLQLGRGLPEVSNQKAAYCDAKGEKYNERLLKKMPIIAFSDPNDLLSYAIPTGFVENYLDSRLCMDVTNVSINIATVYDAFGLGKFANPMQAHIGYDADDRVIALIAKGIGYDHSSALVQNRCQWTETID